MANSDKTIEFNITETGPDTIEARSSDGEIISGMTWVNLKRELDKAQNFVKHWKCNTLIAMIQTMNNYLMSS